MSGKNRYLKGDINPIIAPVKGNVTVSASDLMFRNSTAGSLGIGNAADNYAYPVSSLTAVSDVITNAGILYSTFLGVAMEDSPSGVTENITIATSGVFRYPVDPAFIGSAVTVGALVSAVSAEARTGVSAQAVVHGAGGAKTSTAYLGYIIKTESGASFVDFQLRTAYGPGGVAS